MRVEHPEQGVGQFGKFVVEPVMHARGEERHAFEQPRDMRIVHRFRGKPQPAGDLRMRLGELGGQPAQRIQFALVVGEQRVRHRIKRPAPAGCPGVP